MKPAAAPTTRQSALSKKQLKFLFLRVGDAIEEETRLLRTNPVAGLSGSNARKNRCLYELNLVSREMSRFDVDEEIRAELRALRKKVEDNAAALRANMAATRDVIGILGDAITRAESDGTYPSMSKLPAGYG
jgi:hypothetical protein